MANTLKNVLKNKISTTASTVYTTPSATKTIIIGTTAANILSNNNINFSMTLHDSAGAGGVHVVKNATIAPGGSLVPVGGEQKIILEAGHIVKASSSDSDSVDLILSIVEQT
tara:strand:+ start:350 stop:685 length:336 start_codon:yes stop_codon:yes gene_type:complete